MVLVDVENAHEWLGYSRNIPIVALQIKGKVQSIARGDPEMAFEVAIFLIGNHNGTVYFGGIDPDVAIFIAVLVPIVAIIFPGSSRGVVTVFPTGYKLKTSSFGENKLVIVIHDNVVLLIDINVLTIMTKALRPEDQKVLTPIGATLHMSKVKSGCNSATAHAAFVSNFVEGEGGGFPDIEQASDIAHVVVVLIVVGPYFSRIAAGKEGGVIVIHIEAGDVSGCLVIDEGRSLQGQRREQHQEQEKQEDMSAERKKP